MIPLSYQPHIRAAALIIASLVTVILLAQPIISSTFFIPKGFNEGWNAFYASHAFGEESLYPEITELNSNNYPPVSFYVVAGLGSLIGDNIFAGRLLSIFSFFLIAISIVTIVRLLGGDAFVSLFSGLLFLGYMAAYHRAYVGANDPQLLAHAIMMAGLVLFLFGRGKRFYLFLTALLMLTAGMAKHNLIALPIALTIWLFLYARKDFRFWLVSSVLLLAAASVVLYIAYGMPFFVGVLMAPRGYEIGYPARVLPDWIAPLQLYLTAAFLLVLVRHDRSENILIGLYVVVAGISGMLISGGVGVGYNAIFDLIIAVIIASGLLIGTLVQQCQGRWSRFSLTHVAILILFLPILLKVPLAVVELKRGAIRRLPESELLVAKDVNFIAKHEGPVMCEDLALCYWAGKKFEVDFFNLGQKLKAGVVSEAVITARLDSHYFSLIQAYGGGSKGITHRLPEKVNDAILERYEVSHSSQESGVFLVPKSIY